MDTGLALKQRIRALVMERFTEASCRAAVLKLLGRKGFALHEAATCRAGVLTLESYRAVRGALDETAMTAAAAVELHMEAANALDDVADSEEYARHPEALAVSLALLAAGYSLACEVARDAGPDGAGFAPLLEFHRNCESACSGFFLDAHLKRRKNPSLQDALDMTKRKSGALGRFAAAFGAGLAGGRPDVVAGLGDMGESLFTYRQLVDDLRDALTPADGPSDLSRHKKTLPLVYFKNHAGESGPRVISDTIEPQDSGVLIDYEKSGAPLYGAIVAETFLNRAKKALVALKAERLAVRNLESLVATIEAGSCDTIPH